MNLHLSTQHGATPALPTQGLRERNPLVHAAERILTLMPYLKRTKQHPAPEQLREQLAQEMQTFRQRLEAERYDARLTTAAHYALCVLVDETILKTEWGKHSVWLQQGLLSTFHKETWGGERFYIILKNAMEHLKTHIHLLELMYLCLSLGYEGQYFGKEQLLREEIRNKAFYHIQRYYGKQGRVLSPHGEDTQLLAQTHQQHTSLEKRILWSLGVFCVVAGILNLTLHLESTSVVKALNNLATDSPTLSFTQLMQRN